MLYLQKCFLTRSVFVSVIVEFDSKNFLIFKNLSHLSTGLRVEESECVSTLILFYTILIINQSKEGLFHHVSLFAEDKQIWKRKFGEQVDRKKERKKEWMKERKKERKKVRKKERKKKKKS